MNKDTRIKKIEEIIKINKENPIGILEIPWQDDLIPMNVYKIPLDYLIYNKYNGRILSRTKSLEKQHKEINPESEEGRQTIEDLLWDSKEDRNKKTLHSIRTSGGQQKPGIVTKDGIILDGNRRAMLLGRSEMYDYFKAVILPVTLEENPLEIEKLETTYQMGEDEKLGYNPIEKYLKAKGLYQMLAYKTFSSQETPSLKAIKNISDWMGESEGEIKKYLLAMETMDDYLGYLEYDGIYTQLDEREGQILDLTASLEQYYGEESKKAFGGYTNGDVDELKALTYDYIRIKYEGKKIRLLFRGQRPNHFFGNKDIWSSFRDRHLDFANTINEESINLNSQNLEAHLNGRDSRFKASTFDEFDDNVDTHYQDLRYRKAEDEPIKLIGNANRALGSINTNHKSFSSPEVAKELENVNEVVSSMLCNSSPTKVLSHVHHLLNSVDMEQQVDNKEELAEKAKEIQRQIYQITKQIKKLH